MRSVRLSCSPAAVADAIIDGKQIAEERAKGQQDSGSIVRRLIAPPVDSPSTI